MGEVTDAQAAIVEAVVSDQRLTVAQDVLVAEELKQVTAARRAPDAELVQVTFIEGLAVVLGVKFRRATTKDVHPDNRLADAHTVHHDAHLLGIFVVLVGNVRPLVLRNRVQHELVMSIRRRRVPRGQKNLNEGPIALQTHHVSHPVARVPVLKQRTGLGGVTGTDPGLNRPAGPRQLTEHESLGLAGYGTSSRIHLATRPVNRRDVPPSSRVRAVSVRDGHALRSKLHDLLVGGALVNQDANRGGRVIAVAVVVHPDFVVARNPVALLKRDILRTGAADVVDVKEGAVDTADIGGAVQLQRIPRTT